MKKTKPICRTLQLLAITAGLLCVMLTGCGSGGTQEINLSDYIVFSTSGYDTFGTAECTFDEDAYENDISTILEEKGFWEKASEEKMALAEELIYAVYDPVMDKSSGLSNGDHVEVTTDYEADKYKKIGIVLKGGNESCEVSNLAPLRDFDPFAELQVTFNGISPLCTVTLSGTKEGLTYTPSQDSGLALGDKVTVRISYNGGEDFSGFTETTGLVPTETEKTYEVADVPHYPGSLAEIPEEMKNKMDKAARSSIAGLQENEWLNYFEFAGMDFLGYYYRTPKRINLYQESDYKLYLVYKINVITGKDTPYSFYNYYCFSDVTILPDGTCTCDLDNYVTGGEKTAIENVPGATEEDGRKHKYFMFNAVYSGYNSVDSIFNEVIAKYTDLYDYESTVQENGKQDTGAAADVD